MSEDPTDPDSLNSVDAGGVKSALRVLHLLEHFAQSRRPSTAADLRKHLGLPRSSCFALMETLRAAGYVYSVSREAGYYPTGRWFELARSISAHDPVLIVASPLLAKLRDKCDETAILAKLEGTEVVYLDVLEPDNVVRFSADVGQRKPAFASSSGRALLGGLAPAQCDALLARMKFVKYTSSTCGDIGELRARILEGNKRGYHVNLGEHQADTASMSIAFSLGTEIYAMVVGAPLYRFKKKASLIRDALVVAVAGVHQQALRA